MTEKLDLFIDKKEVLIGDAPITIRRLPLAAGMKVFKLAAEAANKEMMQNLLKGEGVETVLAAVPELANILLEFGVVKPEIDWNDADWNIAAEVALAVLEFNLEGDKLDPLKSRFQSMFPTETTTEAKNRKG